MIKVRIDGKCSITFQEGCTVESKKNNEQKVSLVKENEKIDVNDFISFKTSNNVNLLIDGKENLKTFILYEKTFYHLNFENKDLFIKKNEIFEEIDTKIFYINMDSELNIKNKNNPY